jgi:hypothetical protein
MLVDHIFAQGESIGESLADDSVDESVLIIEMAPGNETGGDARVLLL